MSTSYAIRVVVTIGRNHVRRSHPPHQCVSQGMSLRAASFLWSLPVGLYSL